MKNNLASNNVISFPKERMAKPELTPPEAMAKEMADRKRQFVDKVIEDIGNEVYHKILYHGFPARSQEFIARYSYVLEALRSCLYTTINVEHPFTPHIQNIIDQFHEDISELFEEEDDHDPSD